MRRGLRVGGLGMGGLDRDARNFAIRAQLTNTTQFVAVHNLVRGIKQISGGSVWGGFNLCYPFVGGNANAHSLNLKNPSEFPIVWSGPITHTAMGAVGQAGSNGRGETGFVATSNNVHLGIYINQSQGGYNARDFGAEQPGNSNHCHSILAQWSDNVTYGDIGLATSSRVTASNVGTLRGLVIVSRAANVIQLAKNNTTPATATAGAATIPSGSYRLFRAIDQFPQDCPGRTYAFATQGAPLTAAEALALYNVIQSFQVALGRAVVP